MFWIFSKNESHELIRKCITKRYQYLHLEYFHLRVVYTQQHKSRIMSKVFFEELGIPLNSKILKYKGKTQLQTLSNIMMEFELDCIQFPPSCVIVVGDVDSTLACALVAKKLNIYLAHVEAGLRSNDFKMPEEINRISTH